MMYCPRCGQQQISDQTKFCSRCGFQLGLIPELLTHGGFLPQLAALTKKKTIFNKKNGVIFGILWFITFTMLFTAIMGILNASDEPMAVSAVIGVFGAMMIIIGSLALLPSSKQFRLPLQMQPQIPNPLPNAAGLHGGPQHALPPQQSQPASSYVPPPGGWRADTSDLGVPNSVTESTTRLLQKEEDR
jgi:hypothetical protein